MSSGPRLQGNGFIGEANCSALGTSAGQSAGARAFVNIGVLFCFSIDNLIFAFLMRDCLTPRCFALAFISHS